MAIENQEGEKAPLSMQIGRMDDIYMAYCPELEVRGWGEDEEVAKRSLRNAIEITARYIVAFPDGYMEGFPEDEARVPVASKVIEAIENGGLIFQPEGDPASQK